MSMGPGAFRHLSLRAGIYHRESAGVARAQGDCSKNSSELLTLHHTRRKTPGPWLDVEKLNILHRELKGRLKDGCQLAAPSAS